MCRGTSSELSWTQGNEDAPASRRTLDLLIGSLLLGCSTLQGVDAALWGITNKDLAPGDEQRCLVTSFV